MILRRALRPQAIAKSFDQSANQTLLHLNRQRSRNTHNLPELGNQNIIGNKFEREGVPGFMTPRAFTQLWNVYQKSLVDRVNEATVGTQWADSQKESMKSIHIAMSRQPDRAALYNAAAMAHFNHLFIETLRHEPAVEDLDHTDLSVDGGLSQTFKTEIHNSFDGSMDNLRDAMLDHANAIFGNGFVWLVRYPINSVIGSYGLKVLCTYNAGSPYSEAYKMRQGHDYSSGAAVRNPQANQDNMYGRAGRSPFGANRDGFGAPNALQATPLLCINVWQLAYVLDYGLSPLGKETYTKAWWQTINWGVVNSRFQNSGRR